MNALNDNKGTQVARRLAVILKIAIVFVIMAVILLLGSALTLMTDNSISQSLIEKISETGSSATAMSSAIICLGSAIVAAIWLFVLFILKKIVRTLLEGDPFVVENISRVRLMWILVALSEIVRMVFMNISMQNEIVLDIRPGTWFAVFVMAALAEVFRHGAELRRDAELTI
ncbi:DUF2975 domain-containing protein [Hellea balneolensis]|uniref:DUF2975 domain-containing protein n=1 Tax=Hellea balneolensis TaxID=287478 RepID=UPI0004188F24|nr:DUF2975 domain-containing protein [Hellea balneolensis]